MSTTTPATNGAKVLAKALGPHGLRLLVIAAVASPILLGLATDPAFDSTERLPIR